MTSGSIHLVFKYLFQLQFYFVKWVYIFSSNLINKISKVIKIIIFGSKLTKR